MESHALGLLGSTLFWIEQKCTSKQTSYWYLAAPTHPKDRRILYHSLMIPDEYSHFNENIFIRKSLFFSWAPLKSE